VSDVLDLRPFIRRKQQQQCPHRYVTISITAAELECDACGAPLDPWWYLRMLCEHDEKWDEWRREQERAVDAKIEDGNKILARMNETIVRLNAEIAHLHDVKNRLANERIDDQRLEDIARRRRPRKK
jgi:hypothetical protein